MVVAGWTLLVAFLTLLVATGAWILHVWIRRRDTREKVCVSLRLLRLETGSLSLLITARNDGRLVRVTGADLMWRDDQSGWVRRSATHQGSWDASRYLVKGDAAKFSVYENHVQKWLAEGLKLVPDEVKLVIKLDGRTIATEPGEKVVPFLKRIVAENEAAGGLSGDPTS